MKKLLILILLLSIPAWGNIKPSVLSEEAFGVNSIYITPDGASIIASFEDGTIRLFHANGKFKSSHKMPAAIKGFTLTDNGQKLFIAADKLYTLSFAEAKLTPLENTSGHIDAITADKAGRTGITATGGQIAYFNLISGKQSMSQRIPTEIYALAVDDSTRTVYAGGKDGKIRAFSLNSGESTGEMDINCGIIRSLAVSSNNVLAGCEKGVILADKSLENLQTMSRHTDDVRSVSITPDGRFALSGGDDGVPVMWDTTSGNVTSSYNDENQPIMAVAVDPYFRYIVTGSKKHGDTVGMLNIQYTSNKNELRQIYAFRDATATLNKPGYVDGNGPFGKYVSYEDSGKQYSFDEVAQVVHKPEKLDYAMPRPKVALTDSQPKITPQEYIDTEPPLITIYTRGFAPASPVEIQTIEGSITDNSGVAWAKVDGRPLTLSPQGEFKLEFIASVEREVLITAADIYGNTAEKSIFIKSNSPKSTSGGKNYALLIGINNYKHLAGLNTPEYGVRIMEQVLKSGYNYETFTVLGENATREAIMTEINTLRRRLTQNDRLIVYYAGHGELDTANGNAYWQPYDSLPEDDTHWILTSQVTALLAPVNAPVLIISDSCFSGAIKDNKADTGNMVLITSGGKEPVSDKGTDGHSLFTGALIEALRLSPANASALMNTIRVNLPANSAQTPEYHILSGNQDYNFN